MSSAEDTMSTTGRGPSLGAYPATHLRGLGVALSSLLTNTWSPRRAIFEMVPRDMRTADPTRGAELAEGYFALGDASIELGGRNPFDVAPPTPRFAALLHGFGWLRHMRAHGQPSTKLIARTYVLQWVARRAEHPRIAMEPTVAARRALSLTNQAAYLLDDATTADYQAIMASILADVKLAFTRRALAPDPSDRCLIALACASVAHALAGHTALQRKTRGLLDQALREAFHLDGGPVSRRPTDLAQLLADMLSLRALMEARGFEMPRRLDQTILSAMRMLRMLRHPDGSLARFQGAADATHMARGLVASITTYDTERGRLPVLARQSGYCRLEAGPAVLLMDCGTPPPVGAGSRAHASCLAIEWSFGPEKIITGSPPVWHGRFAQTQDHRHTMAHSTVSVDGASSVPFATPEVDSPLVPGGLQVVYDRDEEAADRTILARHTGYRKRHGVDHERYVALSENGRTLEGRDRLLLRSGAPARTVRVPYTVHFHIEPGVRVQALGPARCRLVTAMRTLTFEVDQGRMQLIDPAEGRQARGPLRSVEIAVTSTPAEDAEITWRFTVHDEREMELFSERAEPSEPEAAKRRTARAAAPGT